MHRSGRQVAFALVALALLGIGGGSAAAVGAHHRAYHALLYAVVAERVASGGAATPRERALALFEHVHLGIGAPANAPVLDDSPAETLVRGFGYCDSTVMAYVRLARAAGLEARATSLHDAHGASPHTVAEVWLDGAWRVFDIYYGVAPRDDDGGLLTAAEVAARPDAIGHAPVQADWYRDTRVLWPRGEGPPLEERLANALGPLVGLAPSWLEDAAQDLYLALPEPTYRAIVTTSEGAVFAPLPQAAAPGWPLLRRARHYHVFGRAQQAVDTYDTLLATYPRSPLADDALYHRGQLTLVGLGEPREALEALEDLLVTYPDTDWADEARVLLGLAEAESCEVDASTCG